VSHHGVRRIRTLYRYVVNTLSQGRRHAKASKEHVQEVVLATVVSTETLPKAVLLKDRKEPLQCSDAILRDSHLVRRQQERAENYETLSIHSLPLWRQ
jgi:hypothetical protein